MVARMKEMFRTFSYITTGVLLMCALFLKIFNEDGTVSDSLLWQILITSFLCVFGNFLYPRYKMTERGSIARRVLHYLYTNAVVFGCARVFRWFDLGNMRMIGFMFFGIAIVFLVVSHVIWRENRKLSTLLNEHLKRYQNKIEQE